MLHYVRLLEVVALKDNGGVSRVRKQALRQSEREGEISKWKMGSGGFMF